MGKGGGGYVQVPTESRKQRKMPWSWTYRRVVGLGPGKEQYVFITTEPSLQSWSLNFLNKHVVFVGLRECF